MNDQNRDNPPKWVQPHVSSDETLGINNSEAQRQDGLVQDRHTDQVHLGQVQQGHIQQDHVQQGETGFHESNALASALQPTPSKGIFSRIKSSVIGMGLKCYHGISMIGHCALICSDACTGKLAKNQKSGARNVSTYLLGLLLVLVVSASAFYYMMGFRSLPVTFLKANIEKSLSEAFSGATVRISDALLQRDVQNGGLFIRLVNMELRDESGGQIAATPEIGVGLKFFPLFLGQVEASSINILAPEVHFVRNEKREWTLWRGKSELGGKISGYDPQSLDGAVKDKGPDDVLPVDFARFGDLAQEGLMKAHGQLQLSFPLSHIGLRNARVVLHEEKSSTGDVWHIPSFTLQYDPTGDKKIIGSGVFEHEKSQGASFWVSFTHRQGDKFVDLKTRLENIVPSELSSLVPVLDSLRSVKVGVSGDMSARIDFSDGLIAGHLKVALSDGHIGFLGDEGPKFLINRGAFVFDMQPGAKHIVMQRGDLFYPNGNISLKGDVWRDNKKSELPDWRFQLYSTTGQIISDFSDVDGAKIDEFNFSGRIFGARAPVVIDEFRAKIGEGQILLAHDGSLGYPAVLRGQVTNVRANLVKAIWPQGFNQESRDWVFKNVKDGLITRASLALQAPDFGQRDALAGEKQTKHQLPSMDLVVKDFVFTVFDDPIVIKTAVASLDIKGKSLVAKMKRGVSRLKNGSFVTITDGMLTIPDYEPTGPDGVIDFKLKTNTKFMNAFLKREPFSQKDLLSENAKNLDGDITGVLKVALPLAEDVDPKDVRVDGKLKLKKFKAQFGKFNIDNGLINFVLGKNYIEAKGNILINGVGADLSWGRKLQFGSAQIPSQLKITGVYDEADRNQLGLPVNSIIGGSVPVEVTVSETSDDKFDIHVLADLSKATIEAKNLGWKKSSGVPATLNLDVMQQDDKNFSLQNIKLDGRDLTVRGKVDLDDTDHVKSFQFSNISYKVLSNIHVKGNLNDNKIWKVTAGGKTFDGRGLLKSILRTGKVGAGKKSDVQSKGMDLRAEFGSVLGWKHSKLSRFKLNMSRRGDLLTDFVIRGALLNGGSLTGNLVSKKSAAPTIRLRSSDTGEALRFVGFYPSMLGGQGQLTVRYNVNKRQLATQTGELIITRFSIASDPVVKEVLSNLSKGKSGKTSNGQDIVKFSKLIAPFSIGQGQFILHDSQVKGELLGATMRGSIDFDKERLRLGGTYIPLYGLNAAVGAVPVLGQILVGRQGEGMLGITFGIYGSIQNPQVLVNPMSLVAPGVFRQIFEFEQGDQNIKLRESKKSSNGVKLDSSASKVIRRKKKKEAASKRSPETSASSVRRREQ